MFSSGDDREHDQVKERDELTKGEGYLSGEPNMGTRGRKRKPNANRYSSGRVKPLPADEARENAQQVALEARQRVFGVSADDAIKQEAGSVIGRLRLAGEIKQYQYEAALKYEEIARAAKLAMLSKSWPSPGDLNRSGGHDSSNGDEPAYVAKCIKDIGTFKRIRRALLEAGPLCQMAVEGIVMENAAMPSAVGDLRLGLNAICRELKMPMPMGQREAA